MFNKAALSWGYLMMIVELLGINCEDSSSVCRLTHKLYKNVDATAIKQHSTSNPQFRL